MPKTKAYKKRKAMRRKARKTILINRALQPIAQRYISKHKYVESVVITSTVQPYAFRVNSMYDPNSTGIGRQPYGRDQLAALYNRYRVIACKIRVISGNPDANTPIRLTGLFSNDALTITSGDQAAEQPRSKSINQVPNGSTMVLKHQAYMPSVVGRSKAQYMADDRYQSDVGNNPAEAVFFYLWATNYANSSVAVNAQVQIEFVCEWFDLVNQASS